MAPPRHGRAATIGSAALAILVLVVVATVGVAVFASSVLAVRLAVAGALAAGVFVWSAYEATVREARMEVSHERASAARTNAELTLERSAHARATGAVDSLEKQVAELRGAMRERAKGQAGPSATGGPKLDSVPELWADSDETPTVVDLSGRRDGRPSRADAARGESHRAGRRATHASR